MKGERERTYNRRYTNGNGRSSLSLREISMPADSGAERAVIATLFVEPRDAYDVLKKASLKPEHFYYNEHQQLYQYFLDFTADHPVEELDEITFKDFLSRRKKEHLFDYLVSVIDNAVPLVTLKTAVNIVKEKAILRRTIEKELEILRSIKEEGDLYKLRELHEQAIEEIKEIKIEKVEPEEWLYEIAFEYSEEEAKTEWLVPNMVPKGSLVLITSQAGVGKTYLMYALIKKFFVPQGEKVIYLDMDNSRLVINKRLKRSGLWQYTKPQKDPRLFIISRDEKKIFVGSDTWEKFKEAMRVLAEKGEHRVIIVDSLKNISRNMDLNSDKETELVMAELKDLMSMGHTLVVVHHVPKILNPELPFKNSGTILDNVEMAFHLQRDKEKNIVTLRCFKTRFDVEPTFHFTIDEEMNMEEALPPEVIEEVNIVRGILEVIGLGGKGKEQIAIEAADRMDIGKQKIKDYLDKYRGKVWEEREEKTDGRPRKAYYPIQGIDVQSVVSQLFASGQKTKESSSACAPAFRLNANPYIYKEKLAKSPKDETILRIAEELIEMAGEIDLEIATTKTPEEALEVIGEDTNLHAILLELYIAHVVGDTEKYRGMIEAVREGKAGIDWAYKTIQADMNEDMEDLDF